MTSSVSERHDFQHYSGFYEAKFEAHALRGRNEILFRFNKKVSLKKYNMYVRDAYNESHVEVG